MSIKIDQLITTFFIDLRDFDFIFYNFIFSKFFFDDDLDHLNFLIIFWNVFNQVVRAFYLYFCCKKKKFYVSHLQINLFWLEILLFSIIYLFFIWFWSVLVFIFLCYFFPKGKYDEWVSKRFLDFYSNLSYDRDVIWCVEWRNEKLSTWFDL